MDKFNAGHLRAIIAGIFAVAIVVGFFMGTIGPEIFMPFATMILGYYFGRKDDPNTGKSVTALSTGEAELLKG